MVRRAARIAFAFVRMNYEAVAALATMLGGKEVWHKR
jgi:hypothetical protein